MSAGQAWSMPKMDAKLGITPRYEYQWSVRVFKPVQKALKMKFANNKHWADVSHVTHFILKAIEQEIMHIIDHVAYDQKPRDFASIVILASVAPKGLYTVLCQCIKAFASLVITTSKLPAQSRVRAEQYFSSLAQQTDTPIHPGTRLSLMFIRDAVYISSPCNVRDVGSLQSQLQLTDIERHLRLLTLCMCADALGTPGIVERSVLNEIAPLLVMCMIHFNERGYTSLVDELSDTPPTSHSVAARRNQIFTFLEGFCPKTQK